MASPCLSPDASTLEKMLEAIAYCEKNRATVDQLVAEQRPKTLKTLVQRHSEGGMRPPTEYQVDVVAELALVGTPPYTSAINNERWGWRLSTMYALQHIAEQTQVQTDLLRAVEALTSEVRRLGRALGERPAPSPRATPPSND